jgi:hypothetical protein
MRKFAVLAVLAAAMFAVVAIAEAGTQSITVTVSHKKAGTVAKPSSTGLIVNLANSDPNPKPSNKAVIFFDKNLKFNGDKFPACTLTKATQNTCPANTKVGTGSAEAKVGTSTLKFVITVFNGAKGHSVLLALRGPIPINLEAKLSKASGLYGTQLITIIPNSARHPAPGVDTPLTKFVTNLPAKTITVKGKKIPYIGLSGCTGGKLKFKSAFTYDEGAPAQNPTTTSSCSK